MYCPRCRAVLHPNSDFCPHCHLPVKTSSAQASADSEPGYKNAPQPYFSQNASQPAQPPYPQPNAYPYQSAAPAAQPAQAAYHYPPMPAQNMLQAGQPVANYYAPTPVQNTPQAAQPQDARVSEGQRSVVGNEARESKREEKKEESENERLLIFSDAIIAFAITVAAIPLKIPKEVGQIGQTFYLELTFYVFGFFLVYNLWKDHHNIFQHLKRNNTSLIALNSIFLAMIVFIPVGFIIMVAGFGDIIHYDALTIGEGALIFLGANFCANILLLFIWVRARTRPEALFGEKSPERIFLGYMTWRLVFRLLSFVAYTGIIFLLIFNWRLWPWLLGIFVLLLGSQWLVFGLYRHRHRHVLDMHLSNEDTMRLQLFSDAIFAIAITITVAQIDPAASASENWSLVGTYIFSFLILGVYWLLHYRIFRLVRRLNSTLVAWNFVFLLFVILAFIPARLYTSRGMEPGGSKYALIFSLYQFMIASVLFIIWQYTKSKKERKEKKLLLLKGNTSRRQSKRLTWVIATHPWIFLGLGIAAAFTPIFTVLYIAVYFTLLGSAWLIGHLATRHLPAQTDAAAA